MPRFFVLFNLRESTDVSDYEQWASDSDATVVRGLTSVDSFEVFRINGALGTTAPYEYVEVIDVNDMQRFQEDIASNQMQEIAAQFQEHVQSPVFIFGDRIV